MSSNTSHTTGDQNTLGATMSKISTGGVKNIEAAYERNGATKHHTPGHAHKLGSREGDNAGKTPGLGAAEGKSQEPSAIGKLVDNYLNGPGKEQ